MSEHHKQARAKALEEAYENDALEVQNATVRERIDLPVAVLALAGTVLLAVAGFFGAQAIDRSGWWDPPVVQPLPDARILNNLRDSDAPFIGGGALADGEGPVILMRDNGQMARFDEETGLVETWEVTVDETELQTGIAAVSAGCGKLQNTDTPCPEPDRLFVLSEGGGIAQSDNGTDWRVRLRDTPWIGEEGSPVEQDDVEAWATSDDGRFIAIFAGAQGFAVFDQQDDLWRIPKNTGRLNAAAQDGAVHLLARGAQFWLGTTQGLARVQVNRSTVDLIWSNDASLLIRDLDVTPNGDLLALTEGPCVRGGGVDCLSIRRVSDPDRYTFLAGEEEKISSLSATTLRNAVMQGGQIIVVDEGGLFAYDGSARSWKSLATGSVDAYRIDAASDAVTATIANRLLEIKGGAITLDRELEGGPFTQIEVTASGMVLGLARDGQVRNLHTDAVLAGREGAVPDGVVFHAGAALGTRVLLLSQRGLLLHDVAARQFKWVDAASLPPELQQMVRPQARLRAAGTWMWLIDPQSGSVSSVALRGVFPAIMPVVSDPVILAGPLRSFHAEPGRLFVVNGAGRPLVLTPGQTQPQAASQVGLARADRGVFRTATAFDGGLVFADNAQLWTYDVADRTWQGPEAAPNGWHIADISHSDSLIVLTANGSVVQKQGSEWQTLVGSGNKAELGLSDLTDALPTAGGFYIAGRGQVQFYGTGASAFLPAYSGGRGDVRLVHSFQGRPIWLSGQQLRIGDDLMTRAPVLGAWNTGDGILAMARANTGRPFAMHWSFQSSQPVCTFLGADPPAGRVIDAALLPEGRILAMTSGGVGIYMTDQRRWLRVSGLRPTDTMRLHITGGHLLVVDANSIRSLPTSAIPNRNSCDTSVVPLNWTVDEQGSSATFDPARGEAALLATDGAVTRWRGGSLSLVLPAPTNMARNANAFQQALSTTDGVVFTAKDELFRYDLSRRIWRRIRLEGVSGDSLEVDVAPFDSTTAGITVWTEAGHSYISSLQISGGTVNLQRFQPDVLPVVRTPANQIRDVSARDGKWIISSANALEITSPGAGKPIASIIIPPDIAVEPVPIRFDQTDAVHIGERRTPDRLFIFPGRNGLTRASGKLLSQTYDYSPGTDRSWGIDREGPILWRIAGDGRLLRCPIDAGGTTINCQTVSAAPLKLDADDVGRVFEGLGDVTWAFVGLDLVQFDPALRQRVTIEGPEVSKGSLPLMWEQHRLLWEAPGRGLWLLDAQSARNMLDSAIQLAEVSGRLLALTPEGLVFFDAFAPTAAQPVSAISSLSAISFDWVRGQQLVGIDADGYVQGEDSRRLFDLPVPQASRIAAVLLDTKGRIWVQHGDGKLRVFRMDACEIPPHDATRPCLRAVTHLFSDDPGLGRMLSVEGRAVHFEGGSLGHSEAGFEPFTGTRPDFRSLNPLRDERATFVRRIESAPDGTSELAPSNINSDARSVRDSTQVRAELTSPQLPFDAMTIGWLSWVRASGTFQVASADQSTLPVPPEQFIRDGRMLLNHPGFARLADASGAIDWITPHAIWRFSSRDAKPALVRLMDLPQPVGLEAGRILFPDGQGLALGATTLDTDVNGSTLRFGALSIDTTWRARKITSQVTRADGSQNDAFASSGGFFHDQRRGIGWSDTGLVIATFAGILPAESFASVLPLAGGSMPVHLRRVNTDTYAERSGSWWRLDGSGSNWVSANDPFIRHTLVQTGRTTWTLDNGQLSISAAAPSDNWRTARDGLSFRADQLVALSATPQTVVIGTAIGTHSKTGGAGMATLGNPDVPDVPGTPFDTLAVIPGNDVIFARTSSGPPVIWDRAGKTWASAPADLRPWRARRAVQTRDFVIDLVAGQSPIARRRTGHPDGTQRMARFEWRAGERMPFDRANAVHAEGTQIYVGTDMGLRMLFPTAGPQLVDLTKPTLSVDARVQPVTRLGRPSRAPDRFLARDDAGRCAEITAPDQMAACSDPSLLDNLRILESDLWRWDKSESGLNGEYVRRGQPPLRVTNNPSPHWPHDTLRSHAVCLGGLVELWSDGRTWREGNVTQSSDTTGWETLHCQPVDAPLGGGRTLNRGLYLIGDAGNAALERTAVTAWNAVQAPLVYGVRAEAEGGWAFSAGRLRIRSNGATASTYEHRRADDHWYAMGWIGGLPAMDTTRGVLAHDAEVDRVTPLGVVRHSVSNTRLSIDPNAVLFRTTDPAEGLDSCRIDRLARRDGRTHTIAPETGAPITIRCRDGRVLTERVNTPGDVGAFQTSDEDIFANRTAIDETDGWRWSMTDETPGQRPDIEITFRDSDVSLSAGRFDLDDYRALAVPFENRVSLVAGRGLWEHRANRFALHEGVRPADIPNPEAVTLAAGDRAQSEGTPLLCLQRGSEAAFVSYTAAGEPTRVEDCADWRGQDALFEYRQTSGSVPTGLGIAANGPVITRTIADGVFTDRIATGLPQPLGSGGAIIFPNPLGAARLDDVGQITALYSYADALGVTTMAGAGPTILTRGGARAINQDGTADGCEGLTSALQTQIPEGARLDTISLRADRTVHLRGTDADGPFITSIPCEPGGLRVFADTLEVDNRTRDLSQLRALPNATGALVVSRSEDGAISIGDGFSRQLSLGPSIAGTLLGTFAGTQPRGVVILTDEEAYLLDVDAALSALAKTTPVAPVPPAPKLEEQSEPEPVATPAPVTQTPAEQTETTRQAPAPAESEPEVTQPIVPEPQPSPTPPSTTTPQGIDLGSASPSEIRAIQDALRQRGFDPGPSDGIVGPRTRFAIRSFQKSRAAPETGELTPAQLRILLSPP
ncbi:peptidoglycan-binding domain-containing protein [Roseovarius pelagicus]|uniref:Peptidoglycan-binding protein n=1 Tax=Roseovarius pelagicus TaxID=2980108 RepID=A0ABY6DJ32_9RHOB|nr:peptidoglycan-binding domain-containing protein [Roseovarius pelagicus]UXX83795.1 peptidoglycan-binding protein [Roseovarius pelagicus]